MCKLEHSSTGQGYLSFRQFEKTNAVKSGRIMKWMNWRHPEQKEKYVLLNTSLFFVTHNREGKKVIEEIAMFCHNLVNS